MSTAKRKKREINKGEEKEGPKQRTGGGFTPAAANGERTMRRGGKGGVEEARNKFDTFTSK